MGLTGMYSGWSPKTIANLVDLFFSQCRFGTGVEKSHFGLHLVSWRWKWWCNGNIMGFNVVNLIQNHPHKRFIIGYNRIWDPLVGMMLHDPTCLVHGMFFVGGILFGWIIAFRSGHFFLISVSLFVCFSALPCCSALIILCFSASPLFCFFASSLLCSCAELSLYITVFSTFPCAFCFSSFSASPLSDFPCFFAHMLFFFS